MKQFVLGFIAVVVTAGALLYCSPANEYHSLKNLTQAQKNSASYKFLIGKFGKLLVKCDPDEAVLGGDYYLVTVMDDGNESQGEALGHGATLQQALDDAAANYISPEQLKAIRAEDAQEEAQQKQREAEWKKTHKNCCANI